eukprot:scaffold225323_cov32-Tisochrysis_lutea.AAC.1
MPRSSPCWSSGDITEHARSRDTIAKVGRRRGLGGDRRQTFPTAAEFTRLMCRGCEMRAGGGRMRPLFTRQMHRAHRVFEHHPRCAAVSSPHPPPIPPPSPIAPPAPSPTTAPKTSRTRES